MFARGFYTVGDDQEEHHKEEIVGHLWVVAIELQTGEEGSDECTPQVFAAIGEHQTGDGGGNETECGNFPQVTSGNDDEEIARERPSHGTEGGNQRTLFQRAHQDVESKEIEKHKAQRTCGEERDETSHPAQESRRTIGGRNLVVGHS